MHPRRCPGLSAGPHEAPAFAFTHFSENDQMQTHGRRDSSRCHARQVVKKCARVYRGLPSHGAVSSVWEAEEGRVPLSAPLPGLPPPTRGILRNLSWWAQWVQGTWMGLSVTLGFKPAPILGAQGASYVFRGRGANCPHPVGASVQRSSIRGRRGDLWGCAVSRVHPEASGPSHLDPGVS